MPRNGNQNLKNMPSPGYGQKVAMADANKVAPIPDRNAQRDQQITQGIAAARQRAAKLTPQQPPAPPPDINDAASAAAQAMPAVQGRLNAPTAYPGVSVSNGLAAGPGAGPEALGPATAAAAATPIWQQLAQATGDPYLLDLARRAGLG
jgi:hypothetical protein